MFIEPMCEACMNSFRSSMFPLARQHISLLKE